MRRAPSLLLAAWLLGASTASASTFLRLSRGELVAAAATVVTGEVVAAHSYWNAERTAILTDALLRVDEVVIGAAPPLLPLRTFGGRVGGDRIVAHGFPTFAPGDRLLLFLDGERDGAHRVTGYLQGAYRLRLAASGETLAEPMRDPAARLLTKDGRPAAPEAVRPLPELIAEIRALAAQAPPPPTR